MTYVREEQNSHAPLSRRSVPHYKVPHPRMRKQNYTHWKGLKVQLKTSWWSLMSKNWCPSSVWLVGKTCLFCVCSRLVSTSQARTSCTPPWTLTATWRTPQVRALFVQLLNGVATTKAIEKLLLPWFYRTHHFIDNIDNNIFLDTVPTPYILTGFCELCQYYCRDRNY